MEQRNKWALSCCLPRQCVSFPCGLSPQGVQVRILHIFFLSRMDVICPTYFILTLSCVTFLNMLVLKGILCALTHYKDGGRPHTGPPWLLIAMFTASAYIWSLSTPSITWGHAMLWLQGTYLTWLKTVMQHKMNYVFLLQDILPVNYRNGTLYEYSIYMLTVTWTYSNI